MRQFSTKKRLQADPQSGRGKKGSCQKKREGTDSDVKAIMNGPTKKNVKELSQKKGKGKCALG
jgi:MarR-like DNA-binding transcriptional regulator SgrR of sgrS sRNA